MGVDAFIEKHRLTGGKTSTADEREFCADLADALEFFLTEVRHYRATSPVVQSLITDLRHLSED